MSDLAKRAAAFISERDPFGDHFSAHDLAQLDPAGGYTETYTPPQTSAIKRCCICGKAWSPDGTPSCEHTEDEANRWQERVSAYHGDVDGDGGLA